jgi:fluoroquinolone transport system permease protein
MYTTFLQSEVKKWLRDPMMFFMLIYPLIFGALGRYLLPWLAESGSFDAALYADLALAVLALMTPVIFGAVLAFSILDDRDDHILTSIKVTPLSLNQFLSFRIALVFAVSFGACAFVMWFADIGFVTILDILAISFLASLTAPMYGMVINAFASNKIEGFAVMKGLGMVMLFPLIALFFFDYKELFFAIAPGFWPAKVISSIVRGEGLLLLTTYQYYFIGFAYAVAANILAYRFFIKKTRV